MMTCTFFGHRSVPPKIELTLRETLIDLIENHQVDLFYVGNHGEFDSMAHKVLKDLAKKYDIVYYVVLAYMPNKKDEFDYTDHSDTILPDGIETTPKRFAIIYRNKWMINKSDYVITYVTNHIASGAAQFKELSYKKRKK